MIQLSVNVDHIATLRQARGVDYPDPVEAAGLAEDAGASGITVHLRGDRRHIQRDDVSRLRGSIRGKLNLEMAATDEMLAVALEVQPEQVTLVPERPEEVTTEGGLDLTRQIAEVNRVATRLVAADVRVSLFLDPDLLQLEALSEMSPGVVSGFEINTDAYTRATSSADTQLQLIRQAARAGAERSLAVYAGHGLTTANVGPVAATPQIEELNIGHAIVSRAALVGMEAAVREMLVAMRSSSG